MPQLKYKDTDGTWKPVPVGGSAAAPPAAGAGLTGGAASYDVGIGTGIRGDSNTLSLNTAYTDTLYSPVSHVHQVEDLTDANTTLPPPAVGDALMWNGTNWVPDDPNPRWAWYTFRPPGDLASSGPNSGVPHSRAIVEDGPPGTYIVSSSATVKSQSAVNTYGNFVTQIEGIGFPSSVSYGVDDILWKIVSITDVFYHPGGQLWVDVWTSFSADMGILVREGSNLCVFRISD